MTNAASALEALIDAYFAAWNGKLCRMVGFFGPLAPR